MNLSYPFVAQHRTDLNHMNYYYYVNAFTDDELDTLIKMANKLPKQSGLVGAGDTSTQSDHRKSEISWIPQNDDFLWIYERITELSMAANAQMWNFDLWGYQDDLQRFAEFVRQDEREACAKLCDDVDTPDGWSTASISASIRARGNHGQD